MYEIDIHGQPLFKNRVSETSFFFILQINDCSRDLCLNFMERFTFVSEMRNFRNF